MREKLSGERVKGAKSGVWFSPCGTPVATAMEFNDWMLPAVKELVQIVAR